MCWFGRSDLEQVIKDKYYLILHGFRYISTYLYFIMICHERSLKFNFIYKIIKQAIEEGKIIRKGDGEEIRDYINVLDAARCSVDILSDEFINESVMLTGTQSTKIKDLLTMIKEMFQGKIDVEYKAAKDEGHYEITPYAFRPKVAKKFVSNCSLTFSIGVSSIAPAIPYPALFINISIRFVLLMIYSIAFLIELISFMSIFIISGLISFEDFLGREACRLVPKTL